MKSKPKDTFKNIAKKGWIKRIDGVNVYVGPTTITGKDGKAKTFTPTGELMRVSCNEHGIVSTEKIGDLPLSKHKKRVKTFVPELGMSVVLNTKVGNSQPHRVNPRAWTGVIRDGKIKNLKRVNQKSKKEPSR